MRLAAIIVMATLSLAGCSWLGIGSDSKPPAASDNASSDEILKRNCADPKWKEQNLGLWYSVCRQSLRW